VPLADLRARRLRTGALNRSALNCDFSAATVALGAPGAALRAALPRH